jgi:hypothetical protein
MQTNIRAEFVGSLNMDLHAKFPKLILNTSLFCRRPIPNPVAINGIKY